MKKFILLLLLILCSCDPSFHENELYEYELIYKIHYPTEVVTETFYCYSHYNSLEPPHHGPIYQLTTNRKGTVNALYVFGISYEIMPSMIRDNCVIQTTMPLQVVSFKQIE